MSVVGAIMVPHPPMIVPDVGRGSEEQISETTRSYERVADEIAALKPDTLIVTSPHSVMYADYFHISPGRRAEGSFARFRAPQVHFAEEYDAELAKTVGVSRNTISSIETGQFNPTAKLALILCIALDKKFEELFYF